MTAVTIPAPEYEWTEDIDTSVIATDPETGSVHVGRVVSVDVRRFQLRWSKASDANKDALLSEWSTAKGEAGTTTYTPTARGEVDSVTVQFEGVPKFTRRGNVWEMSCTLREAYTPY